MSERLGYSIVLLPSARRRLCEGLPESVAAAVWEFIRGPLRLEPHRVGRRLQPPMADRLSARRGTFRILYRVDDEAVTVTVTNINHRRDVYRIG